MVKILNQDDFISALSEKAGFTKGDVKTLYDSIVSLFEGYAKDGITVKLRSFGRLYTQRIISRLGRDGKILPPTTRVIFKLAENIRNSGKNKEGG